MKPLLALAFIFSLSNADIEVTELFRAEKPEELEAALADGYPVPWLAEVLADSTIPEEDRYWLDCRMRAAIALDLKTFFDEDGDRLVFSSASAIPWPLGDESSGWESIFPLNRTYCNCDQNLFWIYVTSGFDGCYFHDVIGVSFENVGTENIRVVENGGCYESSCHDDDAFGCECIRLQSDATGRGSH